MFDKPQNAESTDASKLSNAGDGLGLLAEGRAMNFNASNNSAAAFLTPLAIESGSEKVADNTVVPNGIAFGAKHTERGKKDSAIHDKLSSADFSPEPTNEKAPVDAKPPVVDKPPVVVKRAAPDKPDVKTVPVPGVPTVDGIMSFQSDFAKTSATLPPSEIREATDAVFDRVDKDTNGFLSKEELASAVQDWSYRGQESQVVTALYYNFDILPNLSNDERFNEWSGITRNDMAKFDSIEAARQAKLDSLGNGPGWASQRFTSYDTNKDNLLSQDEIDKGLTRAYDVLPSDHQVLTYLKNNFDQVTNAHNDNEWFSSKQISADDIYDHESDLLDYDGPVVPMTSMVNYAAEMQRPEISRALFANQENPELSVTPDAIKQGYTYDGYFLASVAALANSDPKAIVEMIHQNADHTYTVTFPGDKDHPVTVNPPTDAELAMYNSGSSSGVWASVLEKSYGKYLETYHNANGLTDVEAASHAGDALDALKLLTGREDFKWEPVSNFSKEALTEMLLNDFKDGHGKPIEVSTARNLFDMIMSGYWTPDGFASNIDHAVTGFKQNAEGEYMVTIRSPWGFGDNDSTGTKTITLEQFQKNFQYILHE